MVTRTQGPYGPPVALTVTLYTEDRQFNIWEPENDPHVWMRCNICGVSQQIAHAPLMQQEQFDPVAVFMAQHERCLEQQRPAKEPSDG